MWQGIHGHDAVVEQFRRALERGRLASSFLFVGPAGVGKHAFAVKLAQVLLCETRPAEEMDPCGACSACVQVAARTHPDLLLVAKPNDRAFLPLELLIGEREHRMRRGLCHDIGLKPFRGGRRVAIIDDADHLNAEGANCLLKTLEEPPPRSVLVLVGTSPAKQLPTIRSRCQLVRFAPLDESIVAELLLADGHVGDAAEARRIAAWSEGSVQRAVALADKALWEFRGTLVAELDRPILDSVRLAKAVGVFVDEAGKEAPPRRQRFRQVVSFAAEYYRDALRQYASLAATQTTDSSQGAQTPQISSTTGMEPLAACLDRCLEAIDQIDRNANQATLVECWLDDLGRLAAGDSP